MNILKLLTANQATDKERIGTSYIGIIAIRLENLEDILGKPHEERIDSKVDCEWAYCLGKDTIVTIYNYKSTEPLIYETKWHIGGKGDRELIKEWVEAVFKQKI